MVEASASFCVVIFNLSQELSKYCDDAHASMILLALECLAPAVGAAPPAAADLAAYHAGHAVGLATLLRGTAAHAANGRLYVPKDVMQRHGARVRAVLLGPEPPQDEASDAALDEHELDARRKRRKQPVSTSERKAAKAAVAELCRAAQWHLSAADAVTRGCPPPGLQRAINAQPVAGWYAESAAAASGQVVRAPWRLAFLPVARAAQYFEALEERNFNLHHADLWPSPAPIEQHRPLPFQLKVLGAAWGLASPFTV